MAERRWKRFERGLARDAGTERIPVTGERDGADFEDVMFVYQAKHRAGEFPRTVARWLERVVGKARSRNPAKVGLVVIQRPHQRRADSLVVLRWDDWCDLHVGRPA
jgi:hypothetical protein